MGWSNLLLTDIRFASLLTGKLVQGRRLLCKGQVHQRRMAPLLRTLLVFPSLLPPFSHSIAYPFSCSWGLIPRSLSKILTVAESMRGSGWEWSLQVN